MIDWPVVYSTLSEWQTLLTGVLAVGAAYWAAKPAYRQLALMRSQNAVMVRDTLGEMVRTIEDHQRRVEEITGKWLNETRSAVWHMRHYGPGGIFVEWVSEQIGAINEVDPALRALFRLRFDVSAIEDEKAKVLGAIDQLSAVLWDYFIVEDADRHPEEYDWSDEERAERVTRSREAEGEIDGKFGDVTVAFGSLFQAYENQKEVLLRRMRSIDDHLLA